MKKPIAFEAFDHTDSAICGPVRAGTRQNTQIIRRLLAIVTAAFLMVDFAVAAPRDNQPTADQLTRAIDRWFAAQDNYEPGDLITRSQVSAVLGKLADAGAKIPDAEKIADLALDDNSALIRQLSTPAGRKFMRRLANDPGAFANLDRFSRAQGGEHIIGQLIGEKGGDKLIEYMALPGGRKMLASVPGAGDPNKPTGRIYTVDDLNAAVAAAWTSR